MTEVNALPKVARRTRPQRAIGYINAARQALRYAQCDVVNPSESYLHIQDLIEQTYEVEDEIRVGE